MADIKEYLELFLICISMHIEWISENLTIFLTGYQCKKKLVDIFENARITFKKHSPFRLDQLSSTKTS